MFDKEIKNYAEKRKIVTNIIENYCKSEKI